MASSNDYSDVENELDEGDDIGDDADIDSSVVADRYLRVDQADSCAADKMLRRRSIDSIDDDHSREIEPGVLAVPNCSSRNPRDHTGG